MRGGQGKVSAQGHQWPRTSRRTAHTSNEPASRAGPPPTICGQRSNCQTASDSRRARRLLMGATRGPAGRRESERADREEPGADWEPTGRSREQTGSRREGAGSRLGAAEQTWGHWGGINSRQRTVAPGREPEDGGRRRGGGERFPLTWEVRPGAAICPPLGR